MAYQLTWLPEALRAAGLKVAEMGGWANRGHGDMGRVEGVICHHTGTSAPGNMPTLKMLRDGRGGANPLSGPLAQLGLAKDGTYYVVAAGRANHAGVGNWRGIRTGNSSFIGIEAENAGADDTVWPEWQMDAYRRGVAAILKHLGKGPEMCCGHREYALPKGRKPDPWFDMDKFRGDVRAIMAGTAQVRPIVPAVDAADRPTLERGAKGNFVEVVQKAVGVEADGVFGPSTEAAIRRFQDAHDLRPDGVVGPKTWAFISEGEIRDGDR